MLAHAKTRSVTTADRATELPICARQRWAGGPGVRSILKSTRRRRHGAAARDLVAVVGTEDRPVAH